MTGAFVQSFENYFNKYEKKYSFFSLIRMHLFPPKISLEKNKTIALTT